MSRRPLAEAEADWRVPEMFVRSRPGRVCPEQCDASGEQQHHAADSLHVQETMERSRDLIDDERCARVMRLIHVGHPELAARPTQTCQRLFAMAPVSIK